MRTHEKSVVRVLNEQLSNLPGKGVEVGVWKGELSAVLLQQFPTLHLAMVDLWGELEGSSMHAKDSSSTAMTEARLAACSNTHFAQERRVLLQGISWEMAGRFKDRSLDFAFIDADHFYDSVIRDILSFFPIVRIGGIIGGHDYNGQGDRRKGWGVKRAVDEFAKRMELEVHVESGLVWWVKKQW